MARVLLVTECANGGVPLFIRLVVRGLNGDLAFGIACPPSSDLYRRPPAGSTIHPVDIRRHIDPPRDILLALRIRELVSANGYDIVHLNSSKAGVIGAMVGGRLAAPTIFTPHGLRSHSYSRGSLRWRGAQLVERSISRSASTVVAVSPEEQRLIIDELGVPENRVVLIENGVDLREMSAQTDLSRGSIGVPADAFLVGTIGRLSPQKGPLAFVEAAGLVARTVPNAHFVMVGDGLLEPDVKDRVCSLGLSQRFHLLGWRADAVDVLKLFDVFVLASRYEGMPFVLLEAAAARKPLACTAAPGVTSLVRHGANGLLVDIDDFHALARAVVRLHERPELRSKLAAEAFETIARPRRLELMLDQWRALYRTVAEGASLAATADSVLQVNE